MAQKLRAILSGSGGRYLRLKAILETTMAIGSGRRVPLRLPPPNLPAALYEGLGISDSGGNGVSVVGGFTDNTETYGFLDAGGTFLTLDVPGSSGTEAFGIDG
jgi:hypothetical protein